MGASNQSEIFANQTAFEYTSTRSIFTLDVGGLVQMKATFLSPVTPDDLERSSLPYSYLDIEVQSADGDDHDVQLYTDISAEWVSGDHSATAEWRYGVTKGGVAYHKVWRQQQLAFSEENQQADFGYWYVARC